MPHIAYHLLRTCIGDAVSVIIYPWSIVQLLQFVLGYEARKHGLCWLPESQIWSIPRRGFSLHILLIRIRNSFQFDSSASSLLEITDNLTGILLEFCATHIVSSTPSSFCVAVGQ